MVWHSDMSIFRLRSTSSYTLRRAFSRQMQSNSISSSGYTRCPLLSFCTCRKLVKLLFHRGVEVYMISGGFRDVIEPLADYLGVPRDHVFANKIFFKEDG